MFKYNVDSVRGMLVMLGLDVCGHSYYLLLR